MTNDKTTKQGIDYGLGLSNVDTKTGIRYGVISSHSLNPDVIYDVMSNGADYGLPHCPHCGIEQQETEHTVITCATCGKDFDSSEAYAEEQIKGNKAPYRVFRVSDDSEVMPEGSAE